MLKVAAGSFELNIALSRPRGVWMNGSALK